MKKIKEFIKKHDEIVKYLIFGVLTTFVGWFVYFAVLLGAKAMLGLPPEEGRTPSKRGVGRIHLSRLAFGLSSRGRPGLVPLLPCLTPLLFLLPRVTSPS